MSAFLIAIATLTLLSVAAALWRVAHGPTAADRMMGAQLVGTSGVAILVLLAPAACGWAALDVAVVVALLAAFASIAFAKAMSADGVGDPEEDA